MAASSERASETSDAVPDGVSAFVAKVLNQLSLSAWLPAAVFAAGVTLLAQFHAQNSLSVGVALKAITKHPGQILILVIPVLILTTMLTQAFSYAAIRALEGYWQRRGPAGGLRSAMTRRHAVRRAQLETRRERSARKAFGAIRADLMMVYSFAVVGALELQAVEADVPTLTDADQTIYNATTWRATCKPWDLAKVEQLDLQRADYPLLPSRTMPTKLGNILRATEDSLKHGRDDVQGFAMRRRDLVSPRVQLQHDQFRDRLDMYCTLVFVSVVLAAISGVLLSGSVRWWQTTATAAGFIVFACACYGSAIASARGYCVALKRMDEAPDPVTATWGS